MCSCVCVYVRARVRLGPLLANVRYCLAQQERMVLELALHHLRREEAQEAFDTLEPYGMTRARCPRFSSFMLFGFRTARRFFSSPLLWNPSEQTLSRYCRCSFDFAVLPQWIYFLLLPDRTPKQVPGAGEQEDERAVPGLRGPLRLLRLAAPGARAGGPALVPRRSASVFPSRFFFSSGSFLLFTRVNAPKCSSCIHSFRPTGSISAQCCGFEVKWSRRSSPGIHSALRPFHVVSLRFFPLLLLCARVASVPLLGA